MAEKAGVTKQTQGLYERDRRSPNAEYLTVLAGLGIDVMYAMTGRRSLPPAEATAFAKSKSADQELTHSEKMLLSKARQLTPLYRDILSGIIDSLVATQAARQEMEEFMHGKDQEDNWWPEMEEG